MKTTYYYNSPIGSIKFVCTAKHLVQMNFTDLVYENPKIYTKIASTCRAQLDEYFSKTRETFFLPILFEKGTDFQRSVWNALQNIPYGETRSYKDIANKIGNPKAVRAVGGANNKNPIGIVVPCHRVIGSSGKLVGYAGGLDKKEMLLKLEGKK
ncbi:methylated-DNA--[protein]-cysteine S-methyltransferase [Sulfurimonas sp.]|uniref:methylated-DNA--[protein]-cysteine S-methyltransferase n=1 Tax=Sulfurimonas sp. TaxID=2022749 RepID=UPI00262B2AE5|nr:methylated-DNA--[protein]-cysteine S-methyltransferase [Sulfurimonas sp.]